MLLGMSQPVADAEEPDAAEQPPRFCPVAAEGDVDVRQVSLETNQTDSSSSSGQKSLRSDVWTDTDPDRTGSIQWVFEDGEQDGYVLNRWSPGHPKKDPDALCGAQVTRHGVNNYISDSECTVSLPFICKKYETGKAPAKIKVATATTVRHLREDWIDPPDCKFTGNTVKLFQHSNYRGWKAVLGSGEFRNLDEKVCDNDKLMCEVKPCNAKPNSLSSMKIPGGLAVTLYDSVDFKGDSITLYGPKDLSNLNAHHRRWSDRAESIRVEPAPTSKWLMRAYKASHGIRHQPYPGFLTSVGVATVPWVKFTSTTAFRNAVPGDRKSVV